LRGCKTKSQFGVILNFLKEIIMKKVSRMFVFAFFYTCTITFISCNKDAETPSVATDAVSNITATTADSGGFVKFVGNPESLRCGICWSSDHIPTIDDSKTEGRLLGGSSYKSYLSSLTPNTTYFARAYVTYGYGANFYGGGTNYGSEISFTTNLPPPIILATLETTDVSGISAGYAISGVKIISDGRENLTETGICWGTSENPTTNDNRSKAYGMSGDKTFTVWIAGLRPSTKYHERAYAINSAGASYGNE
jgi:hypothetical protein